MMKAGGQHTTAHKHNTHPWVVWPECLDASCMELIDHIAQSLDTTGLRLYQLKLIAIVHTDVRICDDVTAPAAAAATANRLAPAVVA